MFSNQTGKFLYTSSKGNNYHIFFHEIDSNSTCIDSMKNITKSEMILDRLRALIRMKLQGVVPKHQVIETKIFAAYKAEIQSTHMTYQLVPPNYHRRNIA